MVSSPRTHSIVLVKNISFCGYVHLRRIGARCDCDVHSRFEASGSRYQFDQGPYHIACHILSAHRASDGVFQTDMDGKLFLIKNLLTLREQITPFDIGFAVQELSLDFSVTTDALTNLLADVGSIFSISMENGLLGFLT